MNDELLISASMLSALWDRRHSDTIDLLIPFAEYAIGTRYRKDQVIDLSVVQHELDSMLGYEEMPHGVVDILMKRLSPKLLRRERDAYRLIADLSEEVRRLEERRLTVKEQREKVGDELASYLNARKLIRSYDNNGAITALIAFFETSGLIVYRSPEEIDAIKKKDAGEGYHVGQFILEQMRDKTVCFDYILEMVRGFFVSSAIYLQPNNMALATARFKETTCFLDTRLILNALGLNTREEEAAANQLIDMLAKQGATVACFNHTVDEIISIIHAYKNNLSYDSGGRRCRFVTLPRWDERRITPGEIDVYIKALRVKIKVAGIIILDDPTDSAIRELPFGKDELAQKLREGIRYRNENALEKDAESIVKVCAYRAGRKTSEIERCRGIFVTPNDLLVDVANHFEGSQGKNRLGPAISASHLSAVMWLKCYATHGDYPRTKLIEDAMVATMPTVEVMEAFYDVVDRMSSDGQISAEEYDAIRVGLFQDREIMDRVGGDPSKIDEGSVEAVRMRLRESYASEASAAVKSAEARAVMAEQTTKGLTSNALAEVNKAGRESGERARKTTKALLVLLFAVVGIIVAVLMVQSFLQEQHVGGISYTLLLLVDLISVYDVLKGRWNLASRLPTLIGEHFADSAKERKREELSFILGSREED